MSESEFFCLNHIKTKNMGAGYLIKYNIYLMDLTGNVLHHVKNPKKKLVANLCQNWSGR